MFVVEVFGAQLEKQLESHWSTCTDEAHHVSLSSRIQFWIHFVFPLYVKRKSSGHCSLSLFQTDSSRFFSFTTTLVYTVEVMKQTKSCGLELPLVVVCFFTFRSHRNFPQIYFWKMTSLKSTKLISKELQYLNRWCLSMHEPDMSNGRQMFSYVSDARSSRGSQDETRLALEWRMDSSFQQKFVLWIAQQFVWRLWRSCTWCRGFGMCFFLM